MSVVSIQPRVVSSAAPAAAKEVDAFFSRLTQRLKATTKAEMVGLMKACVNSKSGTPVINHIKGIVSAELKKIPNIAAMKAELCEAFATKADSLINDFLPLPGFALQRLAIKPFRNEIRAGLKLACMIAVGTVRG